MVRRRAGYLLLPDSRPGRLKSTRDCPIKSGERFAASPHTPGKEPIDELTNFQLRYRAWWA